MAYQKLPKSDALYVSFYRDYLVIGQPFLQKKSPIYRKALSLEESDPYVKETAVILEVEPKDVVEAIERFFIWFPEFKKG